MKNTRITNLKLNNKYYLLDWLINGNVIRYSNPQNSTTIFSVNVFSLPTIYNYLENNIITI